MTSSATSCAISIGFRNPEISGTGLPSAVGLRVPSNSLEAARYVALRCLRGLLTFKPLGKRSSNRILNNARNSSRHRVAGVRKWLSGWHINQLRTQSALRFSPLSRRAPIAYFSEKGSSQPWRSKIGSSASNSVSASVAISRNSPKYRFTEWFSG